MVTCYLGIGSNLGDRKAHIICATQKIKALKNTRVIKRSKIIETNPVGGPKSQGKFLNAVIKIKTSIPPATLLKKLKKIENELGRERTVRNGPRTIDLDILLYGDRIMRTKALCIPHPRMLKRQFVLKPLSELIC